MKGSTGGGRVSEQAYNISLKNQGPQERGKSSESGGVNNTSSKNQAPQERGKTFESRAYNIRSKNQAKGKR